MEKNIEGSLWLRPTGPVLERLQELIRRLTQRFGGAWPQPHVTLLSGIELSTGGGDVKLAELAARLQPVTVRLARLDGRHDPFRCFYALAEPTPELVEAHRAACEVFGLAPGQSWEPHLSLLYGHIDAPSKAWLAKELGGRLELSFTASSLHLVNAAVAVPVSRWHTLHECPLRRQNRRAPPTRFLSA
ncbi:MAG TPA: 2'-5' RNA ligase family protein [Verrucomicrobiae bacterium]|nr:2'-5' RNA ligase family protein [Verrucomicrobiae bacterium]